MYCISSIFMYGCTGQPFLQINILCINIQLIQLRLSLQKRKL